MVIRRKAADYVVSKQHPLRPLGTHGIVYSSLYKGGREGLAHCTEGGEVLAHCTEGGEVLAHCTEGGVAHCTEGGGVAHCTEGEGGFSSLYRSG